MSDMWKLDDIGYFNSEFHDYELKTDLIDSFSQHIYYWDIFTFINHLCIFTPIKSPDALQVAISVYLCKTALL